LNSLNSGAKVGVLTLKKSCVVESSQQELFLRSSSCLKENAPFLSKQIITYLGNKRHLLKSIGVVLESTMLRLGKNKLRLFDVFSGSGIVSRLFKSYASLVISNDFEDYARVISQCFLQNRSGIDRKVLQDIVTDINNRVLCTDLPLGFIEEMYSPKDENNIQKEDRVFYTKLNARLLDNYRRMIETVPLEYRNSLMGPLLSAASIHANTAGVFKGFYKDRHTKIGKYGGSGSDALSRIKKNIKLEMPVLSNFECDFLVLQEDANEAIRKVKDIDLAYIDPPYNQHPYGSNYFMLNLLVNYRKPEAISRVSGIPDDWKRSSYNVKSKALSLMEDLVTNLDSTYLLISFNNEGFIPPEEMVKMLQKVGRVDTVQIKYNAFRGSRNFDNRSIHVTEHLFIVEKR